MVLRNVVIQSKASQISPSRPRVNSPSHRKPKGMHVFQKSPLTFHYLCPYASGSLVDSNKGSCTSDIAWFPADSRYPTPPGSDRTGLILRGYFSCRLVVR